jgi:hypothetical protein
MRYLCVQTSQMHRSTSDYKQGGNPLLERIVSANLCNQGEMQSRALSSRQDYTVNFQ